jgi:hypothetical protein
LGWEHAADQSISAHAIVSLSDRRCGSQAKSSNRRAKRQKKEPLSLHETQRKINVCPSVRFQPID